MTPGQEDEDLLSGCNIQPNLVRSLPIVEPQQLIGRPAVLMQKDDQGI